MFSILNYVTYEQEKLKNNTELGSGAIEIVRQTIENQIDSIEQQANRIIPKIKETRNEEELYRLLEGESKKISSIMGITMAYEPYAFSSDRKLFAPFYNKEIDSISLIEETYDYTDSTNYLADWYTKALNGKSPAWQHSGYGGVAGELVIDFGFPILNEDGRPLGLLDYSISLQRFNQVVDSLSVGPAGYGFTLDENGVILTHPNKEYLLKNIRDLPGDHRLDQVAEFYAKDKGQTEFLSSYTSSDSYYFFTTSKRTGWKNVIVFVKEGEYFSKSQEGRQKLMISYFCCTLFAIWLMAFLLKIHQPTQQKLWIISSIYGALLVLNILGIWQLNLKTDFGQIENEDEIINEVELEKYIEEFKAKKALITSRKYFFVPTGFFIETLVKDSYQAKVAGQLWMKYPKDLYTSAPPEFYFPSQNAADVRAFVFNKISEREFDEHILVTWHFRINLNQHYDYRKYPFDQNNVELLIMYPEMHENIILIPDLASYEVLNPAYKPGISELMHIPQARIVDSYYSFQTLDFKSTFGDETTESEFPALVFNIGLQRLFTSPFVLNFIPLIIVSIILFLIILHSSRETEGRIGLTTMNVIQACSGFIFILVLAHVNERRNIFTPSITFLEHFYFISYFFIAVVAIIMASFLKGKTWKMFNYGDNTLIKLLFWPTLITMWFLSTFYTFY